MDFRRNLTVLIIASLFYSSASIFVRLAVNIPPVTLTFYRLSISAIVVTALFLLFKRSKKPKRKDVGLLAFSGCVLAIHFVFFIYAVKNTSVANATFLVETSPVFVAFIAPLVIKEKTTITEVFSVSLALMGAFIAISGAGNTLSLTSVNFGDIAALAAAILMCVYTLIGRRVRRYTPLLSYVAYVYSIAAFVALPTTIFSGEPLIGAYLMGDVLAVFGLAIVSTVLGHSLYNYALKEMKAIIVNLSALLEPSIASLLAFILFQEEPTLIQVCGYLLIVVAITLIALSQKRSSQK